MAAAGSALRLCLRTCRRAPSPRLAASSTAIAQQRTLTTTTTQLARARVRKSQPSTPYPHLEDTFKDLTPEQLKQLEDLVKENDETGETMAFTDVLRQAEQDPEARHMIDPMDRDFRTVIKALSKPAARGSFWHDSTDRNSIPDELVPEFDEDDMTTQGHSKLDEIREHRHYARIAAWEMPLLSSKSSSPANACRPPVR